MAPLLLTVEGFVDSIGGADRLSQIIGSGDPDTVMPPFLEAAEAEMEESLSIGSYPASVWPSEGPVAIRLQIIGYALAASYLKSRMPELPENIVSAAKDARAALADFRSGRTALLGVERTANQPPRILTSARREDGGAISGALYDHLFRGRA